ncbi:ATP-dependent sacrificial sulfur transferase LarE [Marinilabilia rubra]|uniref:ATP-dependent sacrificial sulfur transferase LarE n=1 Tax=Marinilabilia rubra TaxID=2162893 RepID=A0A2U2B423_9BACT|nr:ATP-dependent sacrificial sulfur transferase LarE [Marinilabilia rubra]PWD97822.1 ATP-dependent sacrificial sulfur transferase LarE [Marinilabilia rubra]
MTELDQAKYHLAKEWFDKHQKILIALSGGVDSCLAAFLARHFLGKNNAVAIIGDSPALKRKDYQQALDFCDSHFIQHHTIKPGEIEDPRYNSNPVDRCFWCKNSLYTAMVQLRESVYPEFEIINGSNKSDLGDYRPGLKAADEYNVFSPLADCGFEKEDIRRMALHFELKEWDKPASPCMSSRFPYGENITREKLKMVEMAEEAVNRHGFKDVRARYKSGNATIEVPKEEIPRLIELMTDLNDQFQKIGFKEAFLDKEGLVSGKLNRDLNLDK